MEGQGRVTDCCGRLRECVRFLLRLIDQNIKKKEKQTVKSQNKVRLTQKHVFIQPLSYYRLILIKKKRTRKPCMQECPLSQQFIKLKENMAVYYVGGLSKAHAFNHVMRSVRFYFTEFIILLKTINTSIFICSKPPGLF